MIKSELAKYTYPSEQIRIVNATEVIETAEPPVKSHQREERFVHRGCHEDGEERRGGRICLGRKHRGQSWSADRSPVGRIKGVERPPLAPLFPTLKGMSLLIDCGANVDARPSHLCAVCQGWDPSIWKALWAGRIRPSASSISVRRRKRQRACKRDVPASEGV